MAWLPAAITAGASLLGGFLDRRSDQDYAEQEFQRNASLQKEFAQHGVRWRVADAQAAGVHPVYALGASLPSASPVRVGRPRSMGHAVASAGRAFGGAVAQHQSRPTAIDKELDLRLRTAEVYNAEATADRTQQEAELIRWQRANEEFAYRGNAVQDTPWLDRPQAGWAQYQWPEGRLYAPWSEEGPAESLQVGKFWPEIIRVNLMYNPDGRKVLRAVAKAFGLPLPADF